MQAAGHGGELLVGGYQVAARLGNWSLAPAGDDGTWLISTSLASRDEYWIERGPTRVVLEIAHMRWSWDDIEFDGSSIIRVKGAPREGVVEAD